MTISRNPKLCNSKDIFCCGIRTSGHFGGVLRRQFIFGSFSQIRNPAAVSAISVFISPFTGGNYVSPFLSDASVYPPDEGWGLAVPMGGFDLNRLNACAQKTPMTSRTLIIRAYRDFATYPIHSQSFLAP